MLLEFFEEHLQERFHEADYTFDVYITTAGKVHTFIAANHNMPLLCTAAIGMMTESDHSDNIPAHSLQAVALLQPHVHIADAYVL